MSPSCCNMNLCRPHGSAESSRSCTLGMYPRQRGIQKCLHSQLGRNAEAYVDDMVVKIQEDEGLISNLVETFDNMRKFKMKLNPEKCMFGMPLGKLLRYMVSWRGIDPNLEKVMTITKNGTT
jgi:hypothetical protein